MYLWTVYRHHPKRLIRPSRVNDRRIWQTGCLSDKVDLILVKSSSNSYSQTYYVHMEPVGTPLEPPVHKIINRGPDLRVLPVKIGLFLEKQMEVVLIGGFVEFPRRSPNSTSMKPQER